MLLSFPPPLGFLLCALQKAVLKALFFINYEFRDQIFNKQIIKLYLISNKTQEFLGLDQVNDLIGLLRPCLNLSVFKNII